MFEWKLDSFNEIICLFKHVSLYYFAFPMTLSIESTSRLCFVMTGTGIIYDKYNLNDKNLYSYKKTFKTIHCYTLNLSSNYSWLTLSLDNHELNWQKFAVKWKSLGKIICCIWGSFLFITW